MSGIEADPSTLQRSDELLNTDGSYITSTSEIYRQRNIYLRPSIPRREVQLQTITASEFNVRDNSETEVVTSITDSVDSSISIQRGLMFIHPTTVIFVITEAFARLLKRFNTKYFVSFPDIPCAYCGILCLSRTVGWIDLCIVK